MWGRCLQVVGAVMCRPNIIFVLVLLVAVILSCGEDKDEDNSIVGGDGKAGFSGITEVDEGMNFKSIDPDDWREDGILSDCIVYPNPNKPLTPLGFYRFRIRYTTPSEAYIVIMIRDSVGKIITWGGNGKKPFALPLHHRKLPGTYTDSMDLKLDPGLYRFFFYASESELIMKMLQDTGTTNAPREKYSLVYGDVLIIE